MAYSAPDGGGVAAGVRIRRRRVHQVARVCGGRAMIGGAVCAMAYSVPDGACALGSALRLRCWWWRCA